MELFLWPPTLSVQFNTEVYIIAVKYRVYMNGNQMHKNVWQMLNPEKRNKAEIANAIQYSRQTFFIINA